MFTVNLTKKEMAKQLLRWEPTVSLEEGLEKTIEYFFTANTLEK